MSTTIVSAPAAGSPKNPTKLRTPDEVRQEIQKITGMSEQEYHTLFFDVGMELVERMAGDRDYLIQEISVQQGAMFWREWYRYYYARHDEHILSVALGQAIKMEKYRNEKFVWVEDNLDHLSANYIHYYDRYHHADSNQ